MRGFIGSLFEYLEAHATICSALFSVVMLLLGDGHIPPGG